VARDLGEDIALVADVFDLFEADDCDWPLAVLVLELRARRALRTVRLAQYLERKDLVCIAALHVFEAHQPHARKSACRGVSSRSQSLSSCAVERAHRCPAS
jgi:hypothetical protein